MIKKSILILTIMIFQTGFLFAAYNSIGVDLRPEIYSQLKCCPCKVSFTECTCQEAKEIKAYADALIEMGVDKEEFFYKIAKKFSLDTILDKETKTNIEKRLISEAGEKRPEIVLEPSSFDFGPVSKRQEKISKVFRLFNKGNSTLLIKNIRTLCPCAVVSLKTDKKRSPYFGIEGAPRDWQVEIDPAMTAELELVIDLMSLYINTGKLIRDAIVISNDPIYPEITVRVEAEIGD